MKKVLLLFLIVFCQSVQAKTVIVQHPSAPSYLNYDGSAYNPEDVNYPKINELEKLIFNNNYSKQPIEYRLARLERSVFGAIQRGNLNDRVDKLASASAILNTQNNSLGNYLTQKVLGTDNGTSATKAKRGLSNLASLLLGGQMTGYTPPVTQDPYYNQQNYCTPQSTYPQTYSYAPTYAPMKIKRNFGNLPFVPQYSTGNYGQVGGPYSDLYSAGSGDEFYMDDGRYHKDLRSTGGGVGVKVIY